MAVTAIPPMTGAKGEVSDAIHGTHAISSPARGQWGASRVPIAPTTAVIPATNKPAAAPRSASDFALTPAGACTRAAHAATPAISPTSSVNVSNDNAVPAAHSIICQRYGSAVERDIVAAGH